MKISDFLGGSTSISDQKSRGTKRKTTGASTVTSSSHDSVEITNTSAQLSQLEDALSQIDVASTEKLEAVRQAVAEGSFKVDEQAVANALIQGSIEQLKRQNKK